MICIHADQVVIYNTDEKAGCGCKEDNGNNGNGNNAATVENVNSLAPAVQNGIKEIG